MIRQRVIAGIVFGLFICTTLSGCLGPEEEKIKIAFKTQDDYDNPDANPQRLADFIAEQTGMEVELYPISSDLAAIEALRFGHADVGADQIGHEVNVLQRKRIEQSVLFLELLQLFRSRVATVERRGCGIGGRELHHDEDERDDAEDQGDQYQ